jgi:outer membrane lipoprotein SlyB
VRNPVLCLGLFAVTLLAGCAPATPVATAPAPAGQSVPFSAGTILSMRAVATPAGTTPWRAALLAAASGPGGTGTDPSTPLIEFIVRADDGAILSIVQTTDLDLHKGDRVVIRYQPTAQLARPG